MAITVPDCDAMAAACGAAGVTLVVGQIQHFLPENWPCSVLWRQGSSVRS